MELELTLSETWLRANIEDLGDYISETLKNHEIRVEDVINVQMVTELNGLSRFWIYHKA